MIAHQATKSAAIRARLKHPVIDADGHTQEAIPVLFDYVRALAGSDAVERHRATWFPLSDRPWHGMTPEERRDSWTFVPPWWSAPARNTLDRATASLPRLLAERMDDFGLDFTILYPTQSLALTGIQEPELRRLAMRALNSFHADIYREHADRITPAAVIPMDTPQVAIEELEYAVNVLGLKAVVLHGLVRRPVPRLAREYPQLSNQVDHFDTLGLDSDYDYDPFWAKCVQLKVSPTSHAGGQGWGSRRSISNFMYNHIGSFAAAGDALCKSLFLGGVTRRFPTLQFAFLEGGVSWACALYADLIGHWEKRNGEAIQHLDPANLDHALLARLVDAYGDERFQARRDELRDYFAIPLPSPAERDDFVRCGIAKAEDIRDLFVPNFFFGCEADDPLNAWAFNTKVNPFSARLGAIMGSDIGHWDVPDMTGVLEEAYELVEGGLLTEADFYDFVFGNPVRLFAGANPDFFKDTRCEAAAEEFLRAGSNREAQRSR